LLAQRDSDFLLALPCCLATLPHLSSPPAGQHHHRPGTPRPQDAVSGSPTNQPLRINFNNLLTPSSTRK
jgi:hypothetical protein